MKIRTILLSAGLLAVSSAGLVVTTGGQPDAGKVDLKLKMSDKRGPIRTADASAPSGKEAISQLLGGPNSGSDNGYLIYTKMAPGAHGPALFTLPVEDDYVVISGKMNVQIGTDKFVAGPLTGVIIPANTPHAVWNDGTEPEADLEVITCANPEKDLSGNLMSMMKPAQPTKVADAAKDIREIKVPAPSDLKPGLNRQAYTNRKMGSPITIALDSTSPGSGGPKPHVHDFEQVYFMVDGETTVMYGLENPVAKKNDIVILPTGVVHTNTNRSSGIERHITLLLPEPAKEPFDIEFEAKGAAGGTGGAGPSR